LSVKEEGKWSNTFRPDLFFSEPFWTKQQ